MDFWVTSAKPKANIQMLPEQPASSARRGCPERIQVPGVFMVWLIYVMAIAAGTSNPFQSGANAELNKQLGQPLWAGLVVYAGGFAGILLLQLIFGHSFHSSTALGQVRWWAWTGGLISIGSTMAGLMLAQRLGSGLFTGLSITAALITSVVLDQLGWLGFKQHTASPLRLAGCGLLVAGVWLVARF